MRKGRLSLPDLYSVDGDLRAAGTRGPWSALVAGVAVALVGLVVPALRVLYDYAWFVGFAVAFVLYTALMRGTPVVDLTAVPDKG